MEMKLTVRKVKSADCNQWTVESNYHELDGEFDDRYVSFDGYFGNLNPHMFAAAPMLLDSLRDMVKMNPETATQAALDAINEATK